MPTLTFDRRVPLSEQRLRVALSKSGRKKGKNHGTGERNAAIRRAKKDRHKAAYEQIMSALRAYKRAAEAYWRGEAEHHPGPLTLPPRS